MKYILHILLALAFVGCIKEKEPRQYTKCKEGQLYVRMGEIWVAPEEPRKCFEDGMR